MSALTDPLSWEAFDIESSGVEQIYGLQPWSPHGYLTSYATAAYGTDSKLQGESSTELARIGGWLAQQAETKTPIVGWNTAFDAAWCISRGFRDEVMACRWLDGMTLWRALDRIPESHVPQTKRRKYGLKVAVAKFLPQFAGYDEGVDFSDMSPAAVKKRLHYNKLDAVFTLKIARHLAMQLMEENRRGYRNWLIECAAIPHVADHYITGLSVDVPYARHLSEELALECDELAKAIAGYGVTAEVSKSPTQLAKLLYDEWELPVLSRTPKGAPSTDKTAMFELSFVDERVAEIHKLRELSNLRTKFVDKIVESCDYNEAPVSHPTMNISSTYTGRATFSSSVGRNKEKRQTGFAVHQMKRDARYRRIITAPPGYTIVEWDAAGQEYRWMAVESGDEVMLSLCEPGEDPHSYMGSRMSEFEYRELVKAVHEAHPDAKKTRQAGKVGNLSCQYRIGVDKLLSAARVDHGMAWDKPMAQRVYNAYHASYKGVKKYWRRQVQTCRRLGYVETLAGRRVQLKGNWTGRDAWRLESTAINFPVQGIGADQKYAAIAVISNLLRKYNGRFYFELHDGLYAIFPNAVAEKAAWEGKHQLDNIPYQKLWGYTPPIPMPWDIKIGLNWGDSEEIS